MLNRWYKINKDKRQLIGVVLLAMLGVGILLITPYVYGFLLKGDI